MQLYKCHKTVHAAKIVGVVRQRKPEKKNFLNLEGGHFVEPTDEWMNKNKPVAGGYFVRNNDGYESFSPAEAFEEGYAIVTDEKELGTHYHKDAGAETKGAQH